MPPLILVLILAVDTGWIMLMQHQVAHAARLASRYGITGQAEDLPSSTKLVAMCPGTSSNSTARLTRIRAIIASEASGLLNLPDLCLGIDSYSGYQNVGRPEPLADINGNGRHDPDEAFSDVNGNGRWDPDQAVPTPGGGDQIAVYTLRYVAHPPVGMTPGLEADVPIETRVVVSNEPF